MKTTLPIDSEERKNIPMATGVLGYFPAALAAVATTSKKGNDKHNAGQPMHHARGKSNDHADCIVRHAMDIQDLLALVERDEWKSGEGKQLSEQLRTELGQLAWRALAWSQELHEAYLGAPLAPKAKLPEVSPPKARTESVLRRK